MAYSAGERVTNRLLALTANNEMSDERRPWWLWPILVVVLPVTLVALLLWLLSALLLLSVVWLTWWPRQQYAIVVYENDQDLAARNDAEKWPVYMGAHGAFFQALQEAGVFRGGAGLQGSETATTLKIRGDRRQVQDGPFSDSKEQIGGFYVIDVPDLDAALAWAARCPNASTGGVEVRPLLPPHPAMDDSSEGSARVATHA